MKKLRITAGITVFLILIYMFSAVVQSKQETLEESSMYPEQISYFFNEDWTVTQIDSSMVHEIDPEIPGSIQALMRDALAKGNSHSVDLPYAGTCSPGDIMIYKNTLPEQYAGLTLAFSSTDTSVWVILDGETMYQYGYDGTAPESNRHFADIPNVFHDGELLIVLASQTPNAAAALDNIQAETRDNIIVNVVGSSVADIGCCLLIVMMALIMSVLALIRYYTHQPPRGEVYLGLSALAAGTYCFIGTDTLDIFYNLHEAYTMQAYLVLLVPLFLALYFERNLHHTYPRRFFCLVLFTAIHALAQMLLQLFGIQKLENMMDLSAAVIGVVCITAVTSLIQFDFKHKKYQTLPSILAMLILLFGGIANIISNAFFASQDNIAGQYSMTVFSIMMAIVHLLQLSKEYRANAEKNARLLEEKIAITQQQNNELTLAKKDADAARHEALAANEAKGRFLAHMSHEIRTPINAVLGMDEMILRESREQNVKEYAMDIYTAGQTLLSLINDILDFSKIESGKMEIVPVEYDISSMIHDLANMASQRASNKNIKLEVHASPDIPSRLYGDDVRIRQILSNLLTNAVKYTHEGTVWLRVQCRSSSGTARLTFEVEDTGIGIKEEDLPKLCAEFERIEEDRNRNIEGTGLGMSITLQLLALLGSSLQVESTYGKGSRFYFELEQKVIDQTPIGDFETRVQQIAENYNYSTKFCAPDAKILVVDDNTVNRKVLRNLLKETQIQVTDTDRGAKCLELAQENHYDLIFLDHMMPEMDGIETLHRLKKLSGSPCQDTPVIVLTANAVSGAKEKYLAEGFDDFLSKPIVPEKLEKMIQNMLPDELVQKAPVKPAAAKAGQSEPAAAMAGQNEPAAAMAGQNEPAAAESILETLPQVDGLDWHYAWLHLPDMELLEFTVKEFYTQIDSAAAHLEQAYGQITSSGQLEPYRIQVHAMKGLAATVGILPLFGTAKILEYAAKDGKIDTIMFMTTIFLDEWRSYRQKLLGVFGIGTVQKQTVTDYSLIQALVEMLRLSMQELDIDQADQLSGQLQEYTYPDEISRHMQELSEAVTNLDPEETDRIAGLLAPLIAQMQAANI